MTNVTESQGTVTETNGVVSGNLGTLASGASATVTITATVADSASGTITNTASVTTADQTELDTSNNSDTESINIDPLINLTVSKVDATDPVAAGGQLVYTIVVTNEGPSSATNVQVIDNLPAEVSFVEGTSTVGNVSNNGNNVTVDVGTLGPDASATITLTTTVLSTTTADFSNTATVSATETESSTADNSATATTSILQLASLSGSVYFDAEPRRCI